jgi:hypothetical protein
MACLKPYKDLSILGLQQLETSYSFQRIICVIRAGFVTRNDTVRNETEKTETFLKRNEMKRKEYTRIKLNENRIPFLIRFKFRERFSFHRLFFKRKAIFSDDVTLTVITFKKILSHSEKT